MVTLTTADNALKTLYLGVISNQLNTNTNPLYNKISRTTADVWGKNIQKLVPLGINGGMGAGDESGLLPKSSGNRYATFTTSLKNLYGRIEISDKAIRASANDAGAFVNLLTEEMEGLLSASKFNLSRMLYGNGSAHLATTTSHTVTQRRFIVDSVRNLVEGQVVDLIKEGTTPAINYPGLRITSINRITREVVVDGDITQLSSYASGGILIYAQGSRDKEITGLDAIFNSNSLYGLSKTDNNWLNPLKLQTADLSEDIMQTAIDEVYKNSGSVIDFIVCDNATRRAYQAVLSASRLNVDTVELEGGFKTISFNGIPVVGDKFAPEKTMYMLNTKEFAMHELCDWQWLADEEGSILKQKSGYPVYTAALVKYADLICNKPAGQAVIKL